MRWKALFDDLEGQVEAADRAELDSEVRDRTRREGGLVLAADRLRSALGATLGIQVHGAGALHAVLLDAGPDWLLLEERTGRDLLVPTTAVLAVTGLGRGQAPTQGPVAGRLDLRWALRGLARDRSPLRLVLRDGTTLSGTLDRVGADHVDLAEHPQGELRRTSAVSGVRLVPLNALALLRSG